MKLSIITINYNNAAGLQKTMQSVLSQTSRDFEYIVVDGVCIANGAVIGAGAVVVSDIPPYAVAVGVPAKVIKYRFNENKIQELIDMKWWDNYNIHEVSGKFLNIDKFLNNHK